MEFSRSAKTISSRVVEVLIIGTIVSRFDDIGGKTSLVSFAPLCPARSKTVWIVALSHDQSACFDGIICAAPSAHAKVYRCCIGKFYVGKWRLHLPSELSDLAAAKERFAIRFQTRFQMTGIRQRCTVAANSWPHQRTNAASANRQNPRSALSALQSSMHHAAKVGIDTFMQAF